MALGPVQCNILIELHAEARKRRRASGGPVRHGLADELRVEHGHHLVGGGRHLQKFRERAVILHEARKMSADVSVDPMRALLVMIVGAAAAVPWRVPVESEEKP